MFGDTKTKEEEIAYIRGCKDGMEEAMDIVKSSIRVQERTDAMLSRLHRWKAHYWNVEWDLSRLLKGENVVRPSERRKNWTVEKIDEHIEMFRYQIQKLEEMKEE